MPRGKKYEFSKFGDRKLMNKLTELADHPEAYFEHKILAAGLRRVLQRLDTK